MYIYVTVPTLRNRLWGELNSLESAACLERDLQLFCRRTKSCCHRRFKATEKKTDADISGTKDRAFKKRNVLTTFREPVTDAFRFVIRLLSFFKGHAHDIRRCSWKDR